MDDKRCECAVCQYGHEVEARIGGLPEAARPFFTDMYERLCQAEMDRDWNAHKLREVCLAPLDAISDEQ